MPAFGARSTPPGRPQSVQSPSRSSETRMSPKVTVPSFRINMTYSTPSPGSQSPSPLSSIHVSPFTLKPIEIQQYNFQFCRVRSQPSTPSKLQTSSSILPSFREIFKKCRFSTQMEHVTTKSYTRNCWRGLYRSTYWTVAPDEALFSIWIFGVGRWFMSLSRLLQRNFPIKKPDECWLSLA